MITSLLILQLLSAQVPFVDNPDETVVIPPVLGNNLNTGLIAYYKFDETSGNALSSFGSINITQQGTVSSAVGLLVNSRSLGNANRFVTGDWAEFEVDADPYTIMFWINFASLPTDGVGFQQSILAKYHYAAEGSYKIGTIRTGSDIRFEFAIMTATHTGVNLQVPVIGFAINTWYCVCARIRPSTQQFFLDIRAVGSGSWLVDDDNYSGNILNAAAELQINGITDDSLVLHEQLNASTRIDELGFWRRYLSDCERDKYFNAGVGRLFNLYDILPCQ